MPYRLSTSRVNIAKTALFISVGNGGLCDLQLLGDYMYSMLACGVNELLATLDIVTKSQ